MNSLKHMKQNDDISVSDKQKRVNITKGYLNTGYINKKCLENQIIMPWLTKWNVVKIYISKVNEYDISDYYIQSNTKTIDCKIWYETNNNFRKLMCDKRSHLRYQTNNVLHVIGPDMKEIQFHVGYDTDNSGFIIQNEKIFDMEKQYIYDMKQSQSNKINKLMIEPVNSSIESYSEELLSKSLHLIAPHISDYGIFTGDVPKYDTSYISAAIHTISKSVHTNKDFLTKLGHTIIFIDKFNDTGYNTFKKRIKQEFYLPNILVNLNIEDKLPEIFDDDRVTIQKKTK